MFAHTGASSGVKFGGARRRRRSRPLSSMYRLFLVLREEIKTNWRVGVGETLALFLCLGPRTTLLSVQLREGDGCGRRRDRAPCVDRDHSPAPHTWSDR